VSSFSLIHWIIIAVIIVLLFGAGRISGGPGGMFGGGDDGMLPG